MVVHGQDTPFIYLPCPRAQDGHVDIKRKVKFESLPSGCSLMYPFTVGEAVGIIRARLKEDEGLEERTPLSKPGRVANRIITGPPISS